jgi:hypothetical protein
VEGLRVGSGPEVDASDGGVKTAPTNPTEVTGGVWVGRKSHKKVQVSQGTIDFRFRFAHNRR